MILPIVMKSHLKEMTRRTTNILSDSNRGEIRITMSSMIRLSGHDVEHETQKFSSDSPDA